MSAAVASPFDALIDVIADRVAEKLRYRAAEDYSQDRLPPNMSRRAYLQHCARGTWPVLKVGRLRVTTRADYESWLVSRRRGLRSVPIVEAVSDEDYLKALGGKPARKRA